jgi:acyl-CoA hydrolase
VPNLEGRHASESAFVLQQLMLPSHANQLGVVHGGVAMKAVDEAGAICAMRHTRRPCVTVCIDSMEFRSPVYVGQLLRCNARVTWTGRTSVEVSVKVEAEDIIETRLTHTNSAYIVYVALDESGKPTEIPPLLTTTEEDQRLWREALVRQNIRLKRER